MALPDNTVSGEGDVIVKESEKLQIESVEDVFISHHSATGTSYVHGAQDITVTGDELDGGNIHRDAIVANDEESRVKRCEDVRVRSGAVDGIIEVENVEDVFIGGGMNVAAQDCADVYLEEGSTASEETFKVRDPRNVYIESGAVEHDLYVFKTQDIDDHKEAVVGTVIYDDTKRHSDYQMGKGDVVVMGANSVVLEEDAVKGDMFSDVKPSSQGTVGEVKSRYRRGEIDDLEMERQLDEAMKRKRE